MNHGLHFSLDTVARSVVTAQRIAGATANVEVHLGEAEGGVAWILYEVEGRPVMNLEDWGHKKVAFLLGTSVEANSYDELVGMVERLIDQRLLAGHERDKGVRDCANV